MTTTVLLDANVLVALVVQDHVHHDVAEQWLVDWPHAVATCAVTQGALVRFLVRGGAHGRGAVEVVAALSSTGRHEFWPDDLSYTDVSMAGVVGHRQVTDAYLAASARRRGTQVATFDRGLAAVHPDVALVLDAS